MTPHTTTDKLLLLGGPAYAVLLVIAAAAFPAPPGGDVPPATDPAWLAGHTGAVIAQGYVRGLAAVAFMVLGLGVARLDRRWGTTAAVGAALTGGFMLLAQTAGLAAAQLSRAGGDATALAGLGHLQAAALDASSMPAALLFGATGLIALAAGRRLLAALSLAGVPIALLDSASYDGGPVTWFGLVGLVFFLVWALAAGLGLARRTS